MKAWITRIWIALVVFSIAWLVWNYPEELDLSLITDISLLDFAASLVLILVGKVLTVRLLVHSLRVVNHEKNWKFAWWAYSLADVSKYLPGGIWGIAGRLYLYTENGIPLAVASRAFVIESIIIVTFSFSLGALMIAMGSYSLPAIALISLILVLAVSSYFVIHLLMRRVSPAKKLLCWLEQTIAWLCFGTSFALVSIHFFPGQNLSSLIGLFDLAFTAGFFAFFAPSGIGVREMVTGYWAHLAGQDIATILKLTVLHRGIWIVSDILLFLFAWFYRSGFTKTAP